MASFPGVIRVFTTKVDLVDVNYAAHINELQDEVVAVQNALGTNPNGGYATVKARIANLESTASTTGHTHAASAVTTGTLPVARGGTGLASYTANRYFRANAGGTGFDQRTYAQVLSDIGAAASGHNHDGTYAPAVANNQFTSFNREGILTTFTGKGRLPFPFAVQVDEVRATVNTAPTGAAIKVDVNKNGTTILGATKVSINAAATSGSRTFTAVSFAEDDYLTIDVDQVGSTNPGEDLTVVVVYRPI